MKKLLALLSIGLVIAVLTVMIIPAQACTKIKLCHGTSSDSNPYGPKSIEIDDDAIVTSGHSGHTGPIWFSGITTVWGDIIPPFDYGNGLHYDGMNWSAEGQAIWNNNCQIVTPTNTPTNVPTSTYTPTSAPEDTPTSVPTSTYTPTSIPEDTPTPENTPTSIPEDTPTPENTPTSIPEDTPTPEETPVPSSTPQVETPNPPDETETPVVEVEVNTGGELLAPGLTLIGLLGIAGIQLIGRRRK